VSNKIPTYPFVPLLPEPLFTVPLYLK